MHRTTSMSPRWLGVPTLLISLLLLAPGIVRCQLRAGNAIERPGVLLTGMEGLHEQRAEEIADVISVAKVTIDGLLPDAGPEQLYVEARDATDEYWENVITDRIGAIYVGLGPKGIGELFRPDVCPVGILCQAVAELHNPNRYPGLDRFLTHRFLAPAVAKELGPTPMPKARLAPEAEDVTGGLAMMGDPDIAAVHPDFAAAAAFIDIERQLGWDRLRGLLDQAPIAAQRAWRGFRDLATQQEPTLEEAFHLYDRATAFEVDEDGSILVASFEADEGVDAATKCRIATTDWLPVVATEGCEVTFTDEWATDGDLSLRLDAPEHRDTIAFRLADPDWKYKDWSLFERFEMDVRVEGQGRMNVYAYVVDDPASGHARAGLSTGWMEPGSVRHVSVRLPDDLLGDVRAGEDRYFDGAFRQHEVAMLQVTVAAGEYPFSLWVDNLRLTPKPAAGEKFPADDGAP